MLVHVVFAFARVRLAYFEDVLQALEGDGDDLHIRHIQHVTQRPDAAVLHKNLTCAGVPPACSDARPARRPSPFTSV